MTGAVSNKASSRSGFRPSFQPGFHFWMTLGMSLFVFIGFGITYFTPLLTGGETPWTPVVHLHGAVFFSWMVLLLVQSVLVRVKNVKLHRSLGTFGIAVAAWLVFAGMLITIMAASTTDLAGNGPGIFYLSVFAPPSFGILFAMAIRAVRKPAVHRNLMLIATVSILMPGINRVYMAGLGVPYVPFLATYMTMNAFLAAILFHERRGSGSISRQTWIGTAIVVVPQVLMPFVSATKGWADFIYWLGSLATYQ